MIVNRTCANHFVLEMFGTTAQHNLNPELQKHNLGTFVALNILLNILKLDLPGLFYNLFHKRFKKERKLCLRSIIPVNTAPFKKF